LLEFLELLEFLGGFFGPSEIAPHGVVFTLHRASPISSRTHSLRDRRDKFIWFSWSQ
jgi:hypothetical protein